MLARRALFRTALTRRFMATSASPATEAKYLQDLHALEHHARHTSELWRRISMFFFLPAIGVVGVWAYQLEKEHFDHLDHVLKENGGTFPHPPAYEYLNFRVRPYPWGNNSLFFNPVVNKNVEEEE